MKTNKKQSKIFDIRRLPMDFGRIICWPCLLIFRIKKYSADGTKYKSTVRSGVLVASNHIDFSDPFTMGTAFWYRRVFFLAAEEVMSGRLRKILLKGIGCIKIDRRKPDIEAVKKTVGMLKAGCLVTIFPEGGIRKSGHVDSIKSGAVLMAAQADVPILPMYSEKRKHWYEPRRAVIGEPIVTSELISGKMPSMTDIEKITELLFKRMEQCRDTYKKLTGEI